MMMQPMGGMILMMLTWIFSILGFAYIILILANKETGLLQNVGKLLALVIAVLALLMLVYGAVNKNNSRCPMMGKGKMMMEKDKMMGTGMEGKKMEKCGSAKTMPMKK